MGGGRGFDETGVYSGDSEDLIKRFLGISSPKMGIFFYNSRSLLLVH